MRINFDFLDLEAFLAVKVTGSFHAAAERLNLSQSSVTRRVQKLEVALGTRLFERTTRAVRPTLAAKRLQLRAEAILQEAEETTRALQDEHAGLAYQRSRIVTLATVPTVLGGLVAPAIRDLRVVDPTARVRIMDMAANDVAEAVAQGDADLGICSVPLLEPATQFELLFNDPIVLAIPAGHTFAALDSVPWSALNDQALILPTRGTGNRLVIDEALAKGRADIRWAFEVQRTSSAVELVSQGMGVAPLPKTAVIGGQRGGVDWKPLRDPDVSRAIGLLTRIGQPENKPAASLKYALLARAMEVAAE
ncbi:MAG: LysR family transcriptional regulator [Pseudomonadota bacterium]